MESEDQAKLSNSSTNFDYLDPIMNLEAESVVVDEENTFDSIDLKTKFINVLDQLDIRVEKFRKEAQLLQDKRDFLLVSVDLIKSNDLYNSMKDPEKDEVNSYIDQVNSRLATVNIKVQTVRDQAQEDSLSNVNYLIDAMLNTGDLTVSIQRCQEYLNACSGGSQAIIDKKFESALLGCTLDDQKDIKKRLSALIVYLNKQTIKQE